MKKLARFALSFLFLYLVHNTLISQVWVQVDCGAEFTVAMRSDSTLWSCGFNGNGQLGNGTTATSTYMEPIGTHNDWKEFEAGAFHTLAIKRNGTLWTWGLNGNGQLGDLTNTDRHTPTQITFDTDWVSVAAGQAHSMAIKNDGTLWAWGFNYNGQLGNDAVADLNVPTQIGIDTSWVKVACGGYHTIALKSDGSMWAWGGNPGGQLGTGSTTEVHVPTQVGHFANWVDISSGYEFSMALNSDSTLWSWGFNAFGQLGLGHVNQTNELTQVGGANDWMKIEAGSAFAFAINNSHDLYAWGFNAYGQLGLADNDDRQSPELVSLAMDAVAASDGFASTQYLFGFHTVGISGSSQLNENHPLCTTGANYVGQLGDSTLIDHNEFECESGYITLDDEILASIPAIAINVYPNPASDYIQVETNNEVFLGQTLTVVDMNGHVVSSMQLKHTSGCSTIDIQHLAAGIYTVVLTDSTGFKMQHQFVKI